MSPSRPTEAPHKRGGSVDPLAAGRAPGQPAAERFLHYEPPGSRVGDPGELASSTPVSTSGLREIIRRWADTLLAGDLDAHMNLYGSPLDHFNGSKNVAKDDVRDFKRRLISSLKGTRRFEIYDMRIEPLAAGTVRADFRVEFDAGARSYSLYLRQASSRWKIYGEGAGVQRISTSLTTESK